MIHGLSRESSLARANSPIVTVAAIAAPKRERTNEQTALTLIEAADMAPHSNDHRHHTRHRQHRPHEAQAAIAIQFTERDRHYEQHGVEHATTHELPTVRVPPNSITTARSNFNVKVARHVVSGDLGRLVSRDFQPWWS